MLFRLFRYTSHRFAFFLTAVATAFLLVSCANIGTPSGGRYDLDPPKLVNASPEIKEINVKHAKTITLLFDENVQLDNPAENVIVTPPQKIAPTFTAINRKVKVDLRDSLIPNTTYVLDFTSALADMNEKNVLENFVATFSTGDKIDSLEISGKVLAADNLEPVTGIYVGLHTDLNDSAFVKKSFERISKTNSKGEFTIRGVASNTYRLYALKDANRDFKYDSPAEDVAFLDTLVVPSFTPATRVDTVFKADKKTVDSLVTKSYTRFMPDNIVLRSFVSSFKRQFLKNYGRSSRQNIVLTFAAPTKHPTIEILAAEKSPEYPLLEERSATNDSIKYWITDPNILKKDTLLLRVGYVKTDSLNIGRDQTDTLKILFREFKGGKKNNDKGKENPSGGMNGQDRSHPQGLPDKAQGQEPEQDKGKGKEKTPGKGKGKGDKKEDKMQFLEIKNNASGTIDVFQPLNIEFSEPVKDFDSKKLKLFHLKDSIAEPIEFSLSADSLNPRKYMLKYKWKLGESYKLQTDSAVFHSYYGLCNDKIDSKFSIKKEEDYGMIFYTMTNMPKNIPAFVELLDKSDKPIRTSIVKDGGALFRYLTPGTYYARVILDANNNGKWDTGDYAKKQQPELVCYYNKSIELKANFEREEDWDIAALPLNKQKPMEITKNKPQEKKTKRQQLEEQEAKKQNKKNSSTSTTTSTTGFSSN